MRRHELDVLSLVLGLFFVGTALIWGLSDDPGNLVDSWPLPTLLIVARRASAFRREVQVANARVRTSN